MNVTSTQFTLAGEPLDCLRLECENELNSYTAVSLRNELTRYLKFEFPVFYIDAKDVKETDLSGINEIIHSHYTLAAANRKMVFVYRMGSEVERWVSTTGLDKFVATAILPA
ncbi:MAG TPA: STAS domain-containing protein [Chitinophagaceae bacterium]|nr:STAS domain-containing protein [Chitinophagaceae bacterium]